MQNTHSPELLTWLFENEVPAGREKGEFLKSVQHEMVAGLTPRIIPEIHVAGEHADWAVRTAVWRASPGSPRPVVIHYHGGGWQVGNHLSHEGICTALALAGFDVVSVDYRRAPKHRFPAAFDDALLTYEWVIEQGPALGLNTVSVGLLGDSSGGNLAAAVAAHDTTDRVRALVAIYAIFDYHRCVPDFQRVGMAVDYLADDEYERWRGDPRLSPAVVADKFPPSLLVDSDDNWSASESVEMARALSELGRPPQVHLEDGVGHGFLQAPLLASFDRTLAVIADFLHEHLDDELRVTHD